MATPEDVRALAALARVTVPEEKLASFVHEFDAILAYIAKLDELQLSHTNPSAGTIHNVFREDTHPHERGTYTKKLVEQFPEKEGNLLSVKQIISHD